MRWMATCAAVLAGVAGMTMGAAAENRDLPPIISQGRSAPQQVDRVIGVCHLSESPFVPQSAVNVLEPAMEAKDYYRKKENFLIKEPAQASVLKMPAHGTLVDEGDGYYAYYPEKGYLGNDHATLLVEVGGKKVRMEYFFRVMQQVPDQEGVAPYADNCPNKVRVWKISSTTDTGQRRMG